MKLEDYTGKLNDHESYLKVLKILEEKTKYIELVLRNKDIVKKFKSDIIGSKIVTEWWGTKMIKSTKLFRIQATKEIFEFLRKYETFCKYYFSKRVIDNFYESGSILGDVCESTDFGDDDIAFFDDLDNILLCTTTHEGYIMISLEIKNEMKD